MTSVSAFHHFSVPPHLAMVGLIGAGKTTLGRALAVALSVPFYPEGHSPYLPQFYEDMEKYAATIQFERFVFRLQQSHDIRVSGRGGVQDRSHWEDAIFAECLFKNGKMKQADYETYIKLAEIVPLPVPTALIFLRVKPEVAMQRIKDRGVPCEQSISLSYIQELAIAYESFIEEVSKRVHVVVIDWNEPVEVESIVLKITRAISTASLLSDCSLTE